MKAKLFILAFAVFGLASCAQYTCPTYAKKDLKKSEKVQQAKQQPGENA
ncbi:hypothetical protein FUAX_11130 [Fulvitalea axinellae]|uniref:Lipoprotein n=1 Tax=Fulvitalea axinellae TaxID=1182444 RepID=A0AAU9D743_9BACT|nr:hypothetical protein FUAX_11130 [Fulvitalea axinellae]